VSHSMSSLVLLVLAFTAASCSSSGGSTPSGKGGTFGTGGSGGIFASGGATGSGGGPGTGGKQNVAGNGGSGGLANTGGASSQGGSGSGGKGGASGGAGGSTGGTGGSGVGTGGKGGASGGDGGSTGGTGGSCLGGSVASGGQAGLGTGGMVGKGGAGSGGSGTGGTTTNSNFQVPTMTITVDNGAAITSKETYVTCTVAIDGKGSYSSYSGAASIRGRGNSSWLWYDKKPYRIKLNEKSEILGLKADKDWVLLANYRDPTFLMNVFAFEMADWLGLPYTNHSRFVEVTLNGAYIGLYQLTEQVEQGTNRVAVADDGGILLSLDEDDGPVTVPDAGDNFESAKYKLPVAVKYPEKQTADQLTAIKNDFAKVEEAIAASDYDALAKVLDISSLINFLLLQELTYNVELATPRSMYMHKNPGGVYVMGPAWDFDGGFDFDWTTMMTGHDYFAQQELILSADPARTDQVSVFFVNMFKNTRFVTEFKARWAAIKGTVMSHGWGLMENAAASLATALDHNAERWPIGKDHRNETTRMKQWLEARVTKLDSVINAYPAN
jgi:hypothetical protein